MSTQAMREPYRHLTGLVFFYGLSLFFCGIIITSQIGSVLLVAVFAALMQMSAMWAVLGPGKYWQNFVWSLAGCLLAGVSGLFGMALGFGFMLQPHDLLNLVAFGPVTWTIAQVPYWIMRLFFGWQIDTGERGHWRAVNIFDLMQFTALFAVSLTLMQIGFSGFDDFRRVPSADQIFSFLIPVTIVAGASFLLICWPAIRLVVSAPARPNGKILFAFLAIVLGVATTLLLSLINGFFAASMLMFTVAIWIFAIAIAISLHIPFTHGFVFSRKSDRNQLGDVIYK